MLMLLTSWRRIVIAAFVLAFGVLGTGVHGQNDRPNIVFMLSDDQSWMGTSVQPHPDVALPANHIFKTPRLEAFAREGVRFSHAYAPSPVCSPTRASIVTGQNPARLGWTKAGPSLRASANPKLLPPAIRRELEGGEVVFAELLQASGYATAHFGKWHMGGGGPAAYGFDVSDGDVGNEAASQHRDPNPVDIFGMADRAEAFMAAARDRDEPFFLQLSWLALHAPENALEATKAKYQQGARGNARRSSRAALTEDLDTGVGRVLDAIARLGLAETTYVIYMSDNGGNAGETWPLSGGKGTLGEGGIRVPLIIRGPGIARDAWCHAPVVGFDLFPTFLDWAGVERPKDVLLDGGSIVPLLNSDAAGVVRPENGLVFHFPHYQNAATPQSVLMNDGYKLVWHYETSCASLYRLEEDLGEENDLAAREPERVERMLTELHARLASMNAGLPTTNDSYDPAKPTEAGDRSRTRGDRRDRSGGRQGRSGRRSRRQ